MRRVRCYAAALGHDLCKPVRRDAEILRESACRELVGFQKFLPEHYARIPTETAKIKGYGEVASLKGSKKELRIAIFELEKRINYITDVTSAGIRSR
jgi:hypothetical protein